MGFDLKRVLIGAFAAVVLVGPAQAQPTAYDAEGWIADLRVVRQAFATRYANLEWAVSEREFDFAGAFSAVEQRLRTLQSDGEARALFGRLSERLGDGHVEFRWPAAPPPSGARAGPGASDPCASIGVHTFNDGRAIASRLAGYTPVGPQDAPFPTGVLSVAGRRLGVLRIPVFQSTVRPELCAAALTAMARAPNAAWTDADRRELLRRTDAGFSAALASAVERLKAAGAQVLLIDVAGNGGGSEWAEAAARVLTPIQLRSARVAVIRHPHWTEQLRMRGADLDAAIARARGADLRRLRTVRAELTAMQAEVARPCDADAVFQGRPLPCSPTVSGPLYATGLSDAGDPALRDSAAWGDLFDPYQQAWTPGVWSGPLLVLVDEATASAAEEFAAELQDNRAAVIVGSPTLGAGCGFTNGGIPTALPHSGGTLMLPDCVRLRADGSNEVMGVQPDVLVGFRRYDSVRRRAARLDARLGEALARLR